MCLTGEREKQTGEGRGIPYQTPTYQTFPLRSPPRQRMLDKREDEFGVRPHVTLSIRYLQLQFIRHVFLHMQPLLNHKEQRRGGAGVLLLQPRTP